MDFKLTQTQDQRMQQVLAPHLRQSLEFLQVPMFELRALVQKEMDQNPTLEERPEKNESIDPEPAVAETAASEMEKDLEFKEEYDTLLRLDDEWRDYFQQASVAQPYTAQDAERRRFFLESITETETLQDHLMAQLRLTELKEQERSLVTLLIGSLNDDGYLNVTLGELAETTGFPMEKMESALSALQEMDPIGVGARDLRECLLLQLDRLGAGDGRAAEIARYHLEALGEHQHGDIARKLGCPVEEVYRAARLLATLEPRPGRAFGGEEAMPVTPEVIVQKSEGEYVVHTDDERLPRVRISRLYRAMMENPATPKETRDYIRDKIRASSFLIRSLHQRQQTIVRIAQEIVKAQREFLDQGVAHLRPLSMTEIAKIVGVHETTVSRAIAQKYMQTPRGLFEMKYFFTPGYRAADGNTVSNKAIMEKIQQLVDAEDLSSPLSDQAIAARIRTEGFTVARRTVAKYREVLKIPPSHDRRSSK
ncbi:MAG: RNA polymerase factor sigma-54 [Kiritimatiellia bacterium]|nr:RNA polymerase factor sigma-54 [Kiritimatiellia bacterium]